MTKNVTSFQRGDGNGTSHKKCGFRDYANRYTKIPQPSQKFQSIGIPVDNSEFSTFSTGFSTGVIHSRIILWIFIFGSHKMRFRGRKNSVFFRLLFSDSVFYYAVFFVQKFGLDRRYVPAGFQVPGGNRRASYPVCPVRLWHFKSLTANLIRKKVKKGVDFICQTRYNVCLYGKLEEGGKIHAQH